jgi:hypothetical protein
MVKIPSGTYPPQHHRRVEGRHYQIRLRVPETARTEACHQVAAWLRTRQPELVPGYYGVAITGRDEYGTVDVGLAGVGDCPALDVYVRELIAACPFEAEGLGWVPTELSVYDQPNNDDEDDGA